MTEFDKKWGRDTFRIVEKAEQREIQNKQNKKVGLT
jgi:hypothetical protein